MMEKKKSIGIIIFGWIFITIAVGIVGFLIPFIIYKLKTSLPIFALVSSIDPSATGDLPYVVIIAILLLLIIAFFSFAYLICGIGILKLKHWARYIAITLAVTYILGIPFKALFFRHTSLCEPGFFIFTAFIIIVLWFFLKRSTKLQFQAERDRFKLRSGYGAVIFFIIFFTFTPSFSFLTYKAYTSLRYKKPFFSIKPQKIRLKEINDADFLDKYKRVSICDTSILIPNDFAIFNFYASSSGYCNCTLGSPTSPRKGFIMLDSLNVHEGLAKSMKFKNSYNFEKELYTNNWNPILMALRSFSEIEQWGMEITEIDSSIFKGIIKSQKQGMYDCSIYDKDSTNSRQVTIFYSDTEGLSMNDVHNTISSINFLEGQTVDAAEYYSEGIKALNLGDAISAQFEFANAYQLSPENPEYGYMLAKAIFTNGERSYRTARKILEREVLKLKPDHKEAKELLEDIKKAE